MLFIYLLPLKVLCDTAYACKKTDGKQQNIAHKMER